MIAFEIQIDIRWLFSFGIPTFEDEYKVTQRGIVMLLEPKAESSVRVRRQIRGGIVEYEHVTSAE
jgi:hypothetical protein